MTSVIELHRYTNCSWQFATNNVYCADQEVDDFAVAQSTPLPECIAGFEGDTVRRLSHSRPAFIRHRFGIVLCFLSPLRSHLLCEPITPPRTGW